VQAEIADRLGWLTSPEWVLPHTPRLRRFAERVRADGFTDVVLLGMGGSSLAPEVIRSVMGVTPGWPDFHMLDSTDPAAVIAIGSVIDLPHTLFLLASKSGGTIEPNAMAAHFRSRLEATEVARWADHFVAITDEGTALHRRAAEAGFRDIFINPSDIGGRYSALSFFGLVPASLMGHDPELLADWGRAMLWLCGPGRPLGTNPAVLLGTAMGIGALSGRDKLTLYTPPALDAIGLWIDQLVAESTGKQGRGIVPITGEPVGSAGEYGTDRVIVHLDSGQSPDLEVRDRLRAIAAAGTPFLQIDLVEPAALGAEFIRWELATAFAGALLEVNPFDQPNVQDAKDATGRLLSAVRAEGHLARPAPATTVGAQPAWLSAVARAGLRGQSAGHFLSLLRSGDYFAILAYLGPDPALLAEAGSLREAVRTRARCATTFAYGPRYLHSTGQLHKGGANNGVFLVLSAEPESDLPVPGEAFSFHTLEQAQAIGDFASLDRAGRRALHVHLGRSSASLLRDICRALAPGLGALRPPEAEAVSDVE
jgi:glucose-6-phosphate isomerase